MSGFPISVLYRFRCAQCHRSIRFGGIVDGAQCPGCGRAYPMTVDAWRLALESAVLDGPDLAPGGTQTRDGDPYYLVFGRTPVACPACKQPVPDDALGAGACPSCRAPISIRPVPPELAAALPGITHLIGETFGAPPPSPPGSNPERNFYLWHEPSLRRRDAPRSKFSWGGLHSVTFDRNGMIYLLCEPRAGGGMNAQLHVVCLDPQLQTRWVRTGVPGSGDSEIAATVDGGLLVWSNRGSFAIKLSAADGTDLHNVGGKQPEGADRHFLDLREAKSLAADQDGTILFCKHRRLVRCAADGTGLPTWPDRKGFLGRTIREKLRPFSDSERDDAPMADTIGDHPTMYYGENLAVGLDGRLYIQDTDTIVCFDRTGKRVYQTKLERSNDWGCVADARGQAYIPRQVGRDTYAILRVSPDGQVAIHVDGRRADTPIREDREIAVGPDGTVYLFNSYDVVRVFAPDGSPRFLSPGALEADERYTRYRNERLARGEDD